MKPSKLIEDEIEDKEGEEVSFFSLHGLFILIEERLLKKKSGQDTGISSTHPKCDFTPQRLSRWICSRCSISHKSNPRTSYQLELDYD